MASVYKEMLALAHTVHLETVAMKEALWHECSNEDGTCYN